MSMDTFNCELKIEVKDGKIEFLEVDGGWVYPNGLFKPEALEIFVKTVTAMKMLNEGIIKVKDK